jgi:hypothetical protein
LINVIVPAAPPSQPSALASSRSRQARPRSDGATGTTMLIRARPSAFFCRQFDDHLHQTSQVPLRETGLRKKFHS